MLIIIRFKLVFNYFNEYFFIILETNKLIFLLVKIQAINFSYIIFAG